MNLVWHILKKDLRALRWPLAAWAVLIAMKLIIGVLLLTKSSSGNSDLMFSHLTTLVTLLAGLECVGVVLVASLIQEDRLVGTTAFWATRPISGARLLAAKLIGLSLIFGLLPVAVTMPWWLGCRLSWGEIAWVATETILLHFVMVLIGLGIAVVTNGLGRFLWWTLALVAAIPLTAAIIISYYGHTNAVITADLASTRLIVGFGVAFAGIMGVTVHQFLTRRTWWSIGGILGTLGLILAIALWWPWSWSIDSRWHAWLDRRVEASWPLEAAPPDLAIAVTKAELKRYPGDRPNQPFQLLLNCRVEGLPENQVLLPAVGSYTLSWADATTLKGWSLTRTAWPKRIARRALRLSVDQDHGPGDMQFQQILGYEYASRLMQEPANYTLQTRFTLVETGAVTSIPLSSGRRDWIGSASERVGWVEQSGDDVIVTLVRHRPLTVRDMAAGMDNYILGTADTAWPSEYMLVNLATQHVDWGMPGPMFSTRVAGVQIKWETKIFRSPLGDHSRKLNQELTNALDGSQLRRVAFHFRSAFSHKLTINPLTVPVTAN